MFRLKKTRREGRLVGTYFKFSATIYKIVKHDDTGLYFAWVDMLTNDVKTTLEDPTGKPESEFLHSARSGTYNIVYYGLTEIPEILREFKL